MGSTLTLPAEHGPQALVPAFPHTNVIGRGNIRWMPKKKKNAEADAQERITAIDRCARVSLVDDATGKTRVLHLAIGDKVGDDVIADLKFCDQLIAPGKPK